MLVRGSALEVRFGAEEIFSDVTFTINRGDRAALVGVNGAGKTTLFRLITQELQPSSGELHIPSGIRLALLPQQMGRFPRGPLQETVCREAGEGARALRRMEKINRELAGVNDRREQKELLDSLADAHDMVDSTDAFNLRSRSEKVLAGLGFSKDDMNRQLEEFSGGWRMRASLASLLLSDPDLLMLDEPTNHLDLDARLWLEEYLSRHRGAVWIISHDPGFLDRVVNQVHELEFGELTSYSGNYSFYEKMKREDIARREKQARHQAEQIEKIQRFIKRFKATESKRFQVRSREKMLERIEIIQTHRDPGHMKLRFPDPPRSGRIVCRLEEAGKAYDDWVFRNVDLDIQRGQRVGIVGKNGEGKSTLSRILAGVEDLTEGRATTGSRVSIGFYTQEVDRELDPDLNLLEQLSRISPASGEKELRSLLGGFLFTGDDVFKKTGVLSGGEKSRLALARILLSPVNLLILDEPTNHLDLFSRSVLCEALQDYSGTMVLISHDEQLLSALAQRVFHVGGGSVKPFNGTFDEYLRKKQESIQREMDRDNRRTQTGRSDRDLKKEKKRREAEERKRNAAATRKLRSRIARIERKLLPLEEKKEELETQLGDPEIIAQSNRLVQLQKEHAYICQEIQRYQDLWDEIAEKMD